MAATAAQVAEGSVLGTTVSVGPNGDRNAPGPLDFKNVVEQADVGVCIVQAGVFRYVNPKFAEMHGYRPDELVGAPMLTVVHPSEGERVAELRRRGDRLQAFPARESVGRHRDGSPLAVRVSGRAIAWRGRRARLVTVVDIDDLTCAHQLSAWRARMLASHESLSGSGSIEIEWAARSVWLSEGAQALVDGEGGCERMTLRAALRRVPSADRGRLVGRWRRAPPGTAFGLSHDLICSDGSVRRVLHRGVVEAGPHGASRPVAILQDITERTESQARIERLVNCHPVTGLATRTLLLDRSETAIREAREADRAVAMLYLRMPQLDRVHDALGMQAGDALAVTIADRLVRGCRAGDTVAHLGDGEFAVLFDPAARVDEASLLGIGRQLLAALEQPTTVRSTEVVGAGHVGIAMYPGDASTAVDLLEHARAACGQRGSGVGRFRPEVGERAARRFRLEAALCHALDRRELSLEYQPQVDLRSGAVVGLEALLRWTSDEFGRVSPAEFVPMAEEVGLIVAIGEWVFRSACEQSVAWGRAGLPAVRIGVNLSPRQLEQPDISARLQAIILETGADPGRLGVEVTESMLMRDIDSARRTLAEFAAIGIEISLDDFGTGYSNISLLRALPFHVLKIDRSLVHDVTAAPEDVSVTRGVLLLAQALKIRVLAEGVETEGQLKLLIANGCELMQGFIFSRPLPVPAVEALLRAGRGLPDELLGRTGRRRTLLLVDPEDAAVAALRGLLRDMPCHVVVARSGEEGLARLAEHTVDVIVAEQRLPGMTGTEFLRRAKELCPDTVRIVLSAQTELQTLADAINEGGVHRFLTKPWHDERLRAHVAEAFRHKALADDNRRLADAVRCANLELANANERQEQLLSRQREQLSLEACRALNGQDLLEYLPTALIGIDADGEVAFANRAARALLGAARPLVAFPAEQVLPAEWLACRLAPEGRYHEVAWDGRRHLLSCAEMTEPGTDLRGHLLSILAHPMETELA